MTKLTNILFWAAVFATAALSDNDRSEYHRSFDKTVTVQAGERISMEHKFGDIVIHTHASQDVIIHADIHVSASDTSEATEYAGRVEILVEPSSELFIRTRYPETPKSLFGMHNISFSVHYDVTIPENSPLQIRTAFGGVFADGIKAGSDILTSHGELQLHNARGTQRLEDSFARVEVGHNAGDVSIQTTNGEVIANDITGNLTIQDRFGKVSANRVSSRLKITNGNGAVDASDCGGDTEVKTSFANVTASNVRGSLIVNNNNGRIDATDVTGAATLNTSFAEVAFGNIGQQLAIRSNNSRVTGNKVGGSLTLIASFGSVQVSDIQHEVHIESQNGDVSIDKAGPTDVKTSFGTVHATNIAGPLTVTNTNGAVKASNIKGAEVTTSFAAVMLDGVAGPVQVHDQNGSVEVASTFHDACQQVGIRTSFGAIKVKLEPSASYRVTAKTSFGKIRSDFPLSVQGAISGDEINGSIGSARCEMNLTNQNGAIEILKQ